MKLTVDIASVPDRDDVVAEVWFGNEMLAELSNDGSAGYTVELYPRRNGETWKISCDDLVNALKLAKDKLIK